MNLITKIAFCSIIVTQYLFLEAKISFSNQSSSVQLKDNASLIVSSPILNWDGTLGRDDTSTVAGSKIFFKQGLLQLTHSEVVMTGTYDPIGNDIIRLEHGGNLRVDAGFSPTQIFVKGKKNRIVGEPTFVNPIIFDGSRSELILAIQTPYTQELNLLGGTLTLESDLRISDSGILRGTGTVKGKETTLRFFRHTDSIGGGQDDTFTSTLVFSKSVGLELNNKRSYLKGEWRFIGDNRLAGNGNVLDLSGGGKIFIDDNAQLTIENVYIKGLTQDSINFLGTNARIIVSNASFDLDSDLTFTQGIIRAIGSSYFVMRDKNITFKNNARVSVEGTTLWLDVIDGRDSTPLGNLNIPHALFTNHIRNFANEREGLHLRNLQYINRGIIKELALESLTDVNDDSALTGPDGVNQNLVLAQSFIIQPDKNIHITSNNVTIDGQGTLVIFSDPGSPQFILDPGVTARLQNITLSKIRSGTFQFGKGSKLEIGPNVLFELEDDIVFEQGQLSIVGTPDDPTVFSLIGSGERRKLTLSPSANGKGGLSLGVNTLQLQNIELQGVERIAVAQQQTTDGFLIVGSIALAGNSAAHLIQDVEMSFFIENRDNFLLLEDNDLTFKQFFIFGDMSDNDIHFSMRLQASNATVPQFNFVDDAMLVHSNEGRSGVFFDDNFMSVGTRGSNSFVVSENSLIAGNTVLISGFPIKQIGIPFEIAAGTVLNSDGLNALDTSFIRAPKIVKSRAEKNIITALQLLRIKKKKLLAGGAQSEKEKPKDKKKKKKQNKRAISTMPSSFPQFYDNNVSVKGASVGGDILVTGGASIRDFGIAPGNLRLFIQRGSLIQNSISDTTLEQNQEIDILETDNLIQLRKGFNVLGSLLFQGETSQLSAAELTVDLQSKNAVFDMSNLSGGSLNLPSGSSMFIKGSGTVFLPPTMQQVAEGTSTNPARLVISDLATVKIKAGQTTQFIGNWDISVINGGRLLVEAGQQIKVGQALSDAINFDISDGGLVSMSGLSSAGVGTLTLQKGVFTIKVSQGGIFRVGSQGVCAINAQENRSDRGILTNLSVIDDGILSVHKDGEIIVGENSPSKVGANTLGNAVIVNFMGGLFDGSGFLSLIDGPRFISGFLSGQPKFSGRVQQAAFDTLVQQQAQQLTMTNLVSTLINQKPDLSVTTLFVGKDAINRIRFKPEARELAKDMRIFDLVSGDVVVTDNLTTGAVEGYNGRQSFIIRKFNNNNALSPLVREP